MKRSDFLKTLIGVPVAAGLSQERPGVKIKELEPPTKVKTGYRPVPNHPYVEELNRRSLEFAKALSEAQTREFYKVIIGK